MICLFNLLLECFYFLKKTKVSEKVIIKLFTVALLIETLGATTDYPVIKNTLNNGTVKCIGLLYMS